MNKLSIQDRVQILNCLSEGMGINATARVTGKSKNTVLKLLADTGEACALYQDRVMNNLTIKKVQVDEIWSFVGMKQKNVKDDSLDGSGDCYTFTAIDPETKLMPCWLVGTRSHECTDEFIADLASRLANRVQLTTDGFSGYPVAVEKAFRGQVDYGVLNKNYANTNGGRSVEAKRRYSPSEYVSSTKNVGAGHPNMDDISTSHVERANLSMRMGMRRFTRLTNAFSKKLENHMHAVSFYFMVYNFVKIHKSIRTTPAMEAGVTDFLWSMEDIVMMTETNV
ncbi:MAG: helix-turn-helix domain-containing protein [Ramlibacter sp.]|nr:helix-turn-helix domain-containing protein [Ramlibacter sp.]